MVLVLVLGVFLLEVLALSLCHVASEADDAMGNAVERQGEDIDAI